MRVCATERHWCALWTCLWAAVFVMGCFEGPQAEVEVTKKRTDEIIYGVDDRREPFEYADSERFTESAVALIPIDRLREEPSGQLSFDAPTLGESAGLCPGERFEEQPSAAECSGTLVAPDLVLTAGHCLVSVPCPQLRLVFDYRVDPDGGLVKLTHDQVYQCGEVVVQQFDAALDFAVVRLERPVLGRTPASLRVGDLPVDDGSSLVFAGHPSGLPLKIAGGARVSRNRSAELDFFAASLDAFPGSSGSGVYLDGSSRLAGVLARGPLPAYARAPGESCTRPVQVAESTSGAVEATYLARAVSAFCAVAHDPILCACGDSHCDADHGEDTRTCPADCGAACGDGVCNGPESGDSCYSDCGECGNQVCEPYEVAHLSCCGDCGCPGGFACGGGQCRLRLGNVNGDDRVDARDARAILRAAHGTPLSLDELLVADVDCDGTVGSADAAHVLAASRHGTRLPCERIEAVAAGGSHTCVLTAAGKVHCFGSALDGQLGYGNAWADRAIGDDELPASVGHVALPARATQIAAGRQHTCALLDGGQVFCWGIGAQGQLGHGNVSSIGDDEPAQLAGPVPLGEPAVQIAAGGFHSCALLESGLLKCWGDNQFGQLGYGHGHRIGDDEIPAEVAGLNLGDLVEVAAGLNHTCVRGADGAVRCWGWNAFGQLGYATTLDVGLARSVEELEPVSMGGPAAALAAGWTNTCVVLLDGKSLSCWGDGAALQLGNGAFWNIGDDEVPSASPALSFESDIAGVSIGELRTCVLFEDGSARCFGLNNSGQLGQGHTRPLLPGTTARDLPAIDLGAPASAISAGGPHTCAITSGELRCFGGNAAGQLGYGHTRSIGDDEPPRDAGVVPLHPTTSSAWRFTNPLGLRVMRTTRPTAGAQSRIGYVIENAGQHSVSDFSLIHSLNLSEGMGASVELDDLSTPWSVPVLLPQPSTELVSLIFDFTGHSLNPGQRTSGSSPKGEHVRLSFADLAKTWNEANDYSAAGLRECGVWTVTDRVQVLDDSGGVIYGWTRD